MASKSQLAIILSKLEKFSNPKIESEQYSTDSESAAEILWAAFMRGDIKGKTIADFGCGTGILGIGCLLLGARKAYFVDNDTEAIEITKRNLEQTGMTQEGKAETMEIDVIDFKKKTDLVFQNPPFGTRKEHADREFLMKAFSTSDIIYSFHKASTEDFVKTISQDNSFAITNILKFQLILTKTQKFHKRNVHRIHVNCYRLEKIYKGA